MTATEIAALLVFVPALVFFVFRSGFSTGAEKMLQALHASGWLTQAAVKEFDLQAVEDED